MLRLVRIEQREFPVLWTVKKATTGVVLIDVELSKVYGRAATPLHWFADQQYKPPLDIAIEPTDQTLSTLQVVLQDQDVPLGDPLQTGIVHRGLPVFDVSPWAAGTDGDWNPHVWERLPVLELRTPQEELQVLLGSVDAVPVRSCSIGDGLLLMFDQNDQLVAFRIGPLTEHEWAIIGESSPSQTEL